MTTKPRIVVFGGAGYIGSSLVRHLINHGFAVRVLDNFRYGDDGLKGLDSPDLEILDGDLCDVREVSHAVRDAEAVVLLAAVVGHRFQEVKHSGIRDVNFLASTVALDAAIEHGVERFIFASTDSVYGNVSGVVFETTTPEPVSLYARLKLRMEERVIRAKRTGIHSTVLRIAQCHGFSPRMRFDAVANQLMRDAVCKKSIFIGSAEQCRAMIHVDDVAQAILACLRAHVNLISGETFNLGDNDQNLAVSDVVQVVNSLVPGTAVEIGEEDADLLNYHLSSTKIEKILDWTPKYSLEASLVGLKEKIENGYFANPYSIQYQNTDWL
ncbi:NAD(P)-dependent oxidoreductase [bacterium]|nr:NAD(P)-dependent oxidoreductase [bacterium]